MMIHITFITVALRSGEFHRLLTSYHPVVRTRRKTYSSILVMILDSARGTASHLFGEFWIARRALYFEPWTVASIEEDTHKHCCLHNASSARGATGSHGYNSLHLRTRQRGRNE
jgi:hypothetical protein